MTYYKCLDGLKSCHGGDYVYTLGEWTPEISELEECKSGYHICKADQLTPWLSVDIYECEAEGVIECEDKCIARRIKLTKHLDTWNPKTQRLFAVWCARQVQHLMTDLRSINALDVAERHANGEATNEELDAARAAAAWAAAAAAADAAWAAGAARAAAEEDTKILFTIFEEQQK
jgi:hypothetical protein